MDCNINLYNGELLNPALDFWMPGWIATEFFRLYKSSSTYRGPLGNGWIHNYDLQLRIDPEKVIYRSEQGAEIIFSKDENFKQGDLSISQFKDSVILTRADGNKQIFAPRSAGNNVLSIVGIEDASGNSIRFDYEKGRLTVIYDSIGRKLLFTYNSTGFIEEIFLEYPTLEQGRVRIARYEYDSSSNLIRVIDRAGVLASYEYQNNLLVCYRNANGAPIYANYDDERRCISTYREHGRFLRQINYDEENKTTFVTDSLGRRTVYQFDDNGSLVEEIDAIGNRKQRIYDSQNRLVAVLGCNEAPTLSSKYDEATRTLIETNALGGETITIFNEQNLPISITNAEGHTRYYEYDKVGRLTLFKSPSECEWQYYYDERGSLSKVICPDDYVIYRECGRDYLSVEIRDEWGLIEQKEWDVFGNVIMRRDSLGRSEFFEYDGRNRLIKHTLTDGNSIYYGYDGESNLVRETNPAGGTRKFRYDGYGNLMERIDASGRRVSYEIDSEAQLIAVNNERSERAQIVYDLLGRPVKRRFFDGRSEEVGYDERGNKVIIVSPDGGKTEMEYGPGSLLKSRKLPDGVKQEFTYNKMGRLLSIETDLYRLEYEYDSEGRICTEQQPYIKMQYEYNITGMLSVTRDSLGREVRFEYSPRRTLKRIIDNGNIYELAISPLGELVTGVLFPGGLRQELRYDIRDRLIERRVIKPDGVEVSRRSYNYDLSNNLIAMEDSRRGRFKYEYDASERLVSVSREGAVVERYSYDVCNNLVATPVSTNIIIGAGNRALSAGSRSFEYDACGRLITSREADAETHYSYDGEGQLKCVELPNKQNWHYEYDAFARRTLKKSDESEMRFCWNSNVLHCEMSGNEEEDRINYLFLPETFIPLSQRRGSVSYYYSFDQVGTPTELWDRDGNLVWEMSPDAYGARRNEKGETENPFHFLGQYVDRESGLYYTHFRHYDPTLGRFTTQDPLGISPQLNVYNYPVNPLNWVDPLGLITGPTLSLECRSDWDACQQATAKMKVEAMDKIAKKQQLYRVDPCRTNQRDYYDRKCGGTQESGSTHDVDHLLELQVGGFDKCCSNLWEIPRSPNRSIGSQINHRMNALNIGTGGGPNGCIGGFTITGCTNAGNCTNPPKLPSPSAGCEQAGN